MFNSLHYNILRKPSKVHKVCYESILMLLYIIKYVYNKVFSVNISFACSVSFENKSLSLSLSLSFKTGSSSCKLL